jgi:hypothetical protein
MKTRKPAPPPNHPWRHAQPAGTSLVGRENAYLCSTCRGYTTTIDLDDGVTPMFVRCRAKAGCNGRAASMMYPKGLRPDFIPAPAWEWYRPVEGTDPPLTRAERDHVEQGGLLLRARTVLQ